MKLSLPTLLNQWIQFVTGRGKGGGGGGGGCGKGGKCKMMMMGMLMMIKMKLFGEDAAVYLFGFSERLRKFANVSVTQILSSFLQILSGMLD
jgi:hypothetical protein